MKRFRYKARTKDGKLVTGLVEAVDEKQAVGLLREKGLVVVKLGEEAQLTKLLALIWQRVGLSDLANFTRQLATMINAGLTLVDALLILERQNEGQMKRVIEEVRKEVESGKSLSKALETQNKVFDQVYISLIRAGEAGGVLDQVLIRLADNLERKRDFQSKVRGALLYPAIILVGMVGVMLIMLVYVIPQLADLYTDFEADLPLITTLLISFSKFVSNFWWLGILTLIGAIVGFRMIIARQPQMRKQLEASLLSMPIIGSLWEQIMMATFTRTLATLIAAGVPVVESLHLCAKVSGSQLYEDSTMASAKLVEKGLPLAEAFNRQEHFPVIVSQMLSVGEETGQVDQLLEKIATYFQSESEQRVKNLTTAIEPLILMVLGGGVGFLVFAVVMPIYNLTTAL